MSWAEDNLHFEPPTDDDGYYNEQDLVIHRVPFSTKIHETELAWLLYFNDGRRIWLPKQECTIQEGFESGTLKAPAWLLNENSIKY